MLDIPVAVLAAEPGLLLSMREFLTIQDFLMLIPRNPYSRPGDGQQVILLVEDEPRVREATRRLLQSVGFEVLPAIDAQDALLVYDKY